MNRVSGTVVPPLDNRGLYVHLFIHCSAYPIFIFISRCALEVGVMMNNTGLFITVYDRTYS